MNLRVPSLLKRLALFSVRQQPSPNYSADATLDPDEGIELTVYKLERTPHSWPWIPPELVSLILSELWEAPQPLQARSALLNSIALVNRTWLTLAAYITSRDVHISNKRNATAFLRLLRERSPEQKADNLFTAERTRFANTACRSITFYVDGSLSYSPGGLPQATPAIIPSPAPCPSPAADASAAISLVLHTISAPDPPSLPTIQHISLRYTNCQWGYADAFKHLEQGPFTFPRQATRLSVDYAFTAPFFRFPMCLRWMRTRDCARGYAPRGTRVVPISNLRHLSLSGGTTAFATAILQVCPGIETLELKEPGVVRLEAIAPLPPAARTLVLRHPGVVSGEEIGRWKVCFALGNGLFPARGTASPKPRIVVRSGPPDPAVFKAVSRSCKRVGVELVHERDDA